MNLFISLYDEKDPARLAELSWCLHRNSNLFDTIYVLNERKEWIMQEGLECWLGQKFIKTRSHYQDFANYINECTEQNDINIISNSDIYFDETLKEAENIKEGECYALCRQGMLENYWAGSQDTWIFRGKIRKGNYDFPIGYPGCDNKIAFELDKAGYKVTNPMHSIKTHHNHKNETWYEGQNDKYRLPKPYKLVPPCSL